MGYRLSLLDKSPIDRDESATQALARTLQLALAAERAGYHRFWVAEHHDTGQLAGPSPEVLIAYLLARTERIRVGSGGVMLNHYSPYKVAENFNLLAALAPGRVDLAVGKAPGGLPLSSRALQFGRDSAQWPEFAELLRMLDGFLDGGDAPALEAPRATPIPDRPAERFLLGASAESAGLAAARGWRFVYASHLNGDEQALAKVFEIYRQASGGSTPVLAVAAIVAGDAEQARRLLGDQRQLKLHLEGGQSVNLNSREQAEAFIRQASGSAGRELAYRLEERTPYVLHGTADEVAAGLDRLHQRYGVEEFVIDTPVTNRDERIASVSLLAEHYRARTQRGREEA